MYATSVNETGEPEGSLPKSLLSDCVETSVVASGHQWVLFRRDPDRRLSFLLLNPVDASCRGDGLVNLDATHRIPDAKVLRCFGRTELTTSLLY